MSNTKSSLKCLLFIAIAFLGCTDIPDDLRDEAKGDGSSSSWFSSDSWQQEVSSSSEAGGGSSSSVRGSSSSEAGGSSSSELGSSSSEVVGSSSSLLGSSSSLQSSSSVITYSVDYNANGGSGAPASQTKIHDVALTLSTSVPTKTNLTFTGWNTSSDGSGTSYASGASYTANVGVTLYAQWTVNTYTVTYNANGGSGAPASQTKTHDVILTLSTSVPTRTNYTFTGWNTSANGSGTSYASGASYTANAGVTLHAQWICSPGIVNGPSVSYGGETYESVVICGQTWLKRNLNYAFEGSKCGDGNGLSNDNTSTCDAYGRLYNWATAMALPSSCNSTSCSSQVLAKHRGICPSGWHIPSDEEWTTLTDYVGGSSTAGTKLKATNGWNDYNGSSGNGTDDYGFSALPGGYGPSNGSFGYVGSYGNWWSATETNASYAYRRYMDHGLATVGRYYYDKAYLFSVRCVQD